jgi:hypothetical protein
MSQFLMQAMGVEQGRVGAKQITAEAQRTRRKTRGKYYLSKLIVSARQPGASWWPVPLLHDESCWVPAFTGMTKGYFTVYNATPFSVFSASSASLR